MLFLRSPHIWPFNHGDKQVIAPFLITLRMANQTALTSDTIISGNIGSLHFQGTEKSTDGIESLPNANR